MQKWHFLAFFSNNKWNTVFLHDKQNAKIAILSVFLCSNKWTTFSLHDKQIAKRRFTIFLFTNKWTTFLSPYKPNGKMAFLNVFLFSDKWTILFLQIVNKMKKWRFLELLFSVTNELLFVTWETKCKNVVT